MVLNWSLSDSKSPQVFWTLFSILADLNNAIVLIVSTCPLISKSSCPCTNHLATYRARLLQVVSLPLSSSIVCFFFSSLASSGYLSLFSLSCDQPERQSSPFDRFSFLLTITSSVVRPRLGELFLSPHPRGVCASHFIGPTVGCAYTICSYGQI